jgi:ABC-type nitrate/sulfonate/bicarbonate transport system ATPase subunit
MYNNKGKLDVVPDGIILLIGTSGAGKSSFLNKTLGLDVVSEGHGIDSGRGDASKHRSMLTSRLL